MKVYVIKWAGEIQQVFLQKAEAHRNADYWPVEMKPSITVEAYELKEIV